jgi:hypothetical protein
MDFEDILKHFRISIIVLGYLFNYCFTLNGIRGESMASDYHSRIGNVKWIVILNTSVMWNVDILRELSLSVSC